MERQRFVCLLTFLTLLSVLVFGSALAADGQPAARGSVNTPAVDLRAIMGGELPPLVVRALVAGCGPSDPDVVIHDDGVAENGYGWNPVANVGRLADKFEPATYPATISSVCFAFITNAGVTEFNFEIAVYAADGAGGAPGTELGRLSAVGHPMSISGPLPATPTFEQFDVSAMGINITAGSVYISAEWNAAVEPGGVYLAADESPTTPLNGGHLRANDDPWTPIDDSHGNYRAMFIRAVMPSAGPGAPSVQKSFAPGQILAGDTSTLTITLRNNSQPSAAVLDADFVDTLPANVVVATPANAATTCTGTLVATAGSGTITLQSGASIPASGSCTITVDVTSDTDGTYVNTIPAGALSTQHGSNAGAATATLRVGFVFPEPYPPVTFPQGVEPITNVTFAGIDNTTPATSSIPLEDFTHIIGNVGPGHTYHISVEGNTMGTYTSYVNVFIDWNRNGAFEAGEEVQIGTIYDSTGTDGVKAEADITVPGTAPAGSTRMRVIKRFGQYAPPNNSAGYGQAEDYTLVVSDASGGPWTVTPSVGAGTGTISPDTPQTIDDGDTATFTLTPGSGYEIRDVTGTCGGTLTGNSFETAPVTGDCTVIANFQIATGDPDIVCFAPNHTVQASTTGTYIRWEDNTFSDGSAITPWNFNPWGSTNLYFYFNSAANGGVASSASGGTWLVLGPGDVIDGSLTYNSSMAQPTAWNVGVDGYLGFRFTCSTASTCYGWAHITTTGPAGHPATVREYCFNSAGDPITIGGGADEPNIDVSPLNLSSTQAPDVTTNQTLTIANTGDADLVWSIDTEPTLRPEAVPAGGSVAKLGPPTPVQRTAEELRDLQSAINAEEVHDGGFEAGTPNPFWTEYSLTFGTVLCTEDDCGNGGGTSFPRSGEWWAWFGGISGTYEEGRVSQSVTIPSGGPATLTFHVMNGACSGEADDYLEVTMDGTQLWQTTGAAPECGTTSYRQITVDVSAYADGAAHTLEFHSEIFGPVGNNFALDDVSLNSADGPVVCTNLANVAWLSVSPTSGTTAAGTSTPVTVTFDSTGLAAATYTANLCIESDDPDAGPGNGTDLVVVPVSLTVTAPATHTVTSSVGTPSGTIAPPSQTVAHGATATFTLTPAAGYEIASVGGTCPYGSLLGTTYTTGPITADCEVVANFRLIPPNIDVSPLAMSSTQAPDVTTNQTLTIANAGEADLEWEIAEEPVLRPLRRSVAERSGGVSGHGEWLYRAETGTPAPSNRGGTKLARPAAYRWHGARLAPMNILIYADDDHHTAPDTFLDQALQALGLSYTAHYDDDFAGFEADLALGGWDLVLFGNDNYWPESSTLDALNAYAAGGGRVIVTSWVMSDDPGHALWTTLGATWVADDDDPPAPVYWWQPGHRFFNLPNGVPEFTSLAHVGYGTYGQYVEPLAGFQALAGYTTPGPDPNQAALILGNGGRTIFKGFLDGQNDADLDDDGVLDGVELWINMISSLSLSLCTNLAVVPWLSVSPASGTTAPAASTPVAVTFDSTGLAAATYTANLCITSNDPDAGPGNGTDLVVVPVQLVVEDTGPTTHTVTSSVGAPGGTIEPPSQAVVHGASATFTLTPDAGFEIDDVGGTCPMGSFSGNQYTTGAITEDCEVVASFRQLTHTVTSRAGTPGGTIAPPSQAVVHGATATFTLTPAVGYEIASVGGTCPYGSLVGTTYTTGPITADCEVVANFRADPSVLAVPTLGPAGGALLGLLLAGLGLSVLRRRRA